ncbi:MAG TPA: right-handed parallel beta-helix repeat-containing protein [Vicinamibacterales bacterium]|nr:right-handed parallel beta-helix repeat-containing protein [Vicinamibacterales bacterium]
MRSLVLASVFIAAIAAVGRALDPGEQRSNVPEIQLTTGVVIDRSVRIRPGTYRLPSSALDRPAVTIRGSNVTVTMTGVTIEGGAPFADPDRYTGTGVLIEGAGVTLTGGAVRGFKVAVLARSTPRLHLSHLDLSYNWKPRLKGGIEQEDQADWLSFHDNERDEWLRYGAAIYLSGADGAEIDRVRAVQGMNGLMVTRSSRLTIWNNTFSYLSGAGIGLYRTSDSRIMHNKVDWCVRGYSHGFYNRGQDSTAILMYEQSSRNVVAFNSFTHGGDGVFLWAGQSTMDTGQGGANDNLFYDNDVSHAVANGIEATFSRNAFVNNRIEDCWHGIWGGYSFDSIIAGNAFANNTEGIAIEHGQNIVIAGNTFTGEGTAIRLWANPTQDPDWGYPKFRDTSSRDYTIAGNRFDGVAKDIDVTSTSGISRDDSPGAARRYTSPVPPARMTGGMDARLPPGARRGRGTIIVDEWGPYDYLSPKLWPAGRASDRPLIIRMLGPAGRWTLASIRGATTSARTGGVPGEIAVTPADPAIDFTIDVDYVGGEVVTPRGELIAAGRPYRVSYSVFEPAIDWTIKFWTFDAASDPLTQPAAFAAKLKTAPVRTEPSSRLAFANARAFGDGFATRIAVAATGSLTLPPGAYELIVTSDDGIRLWLDDSLVLEDWTIHGPKEDRVPIGAGRHALRLEYFQNTGAAAFQVRVGRR